MNDLYGIKERQSHIYCLNSNIYHYGNSKTKNRRRTGYRKH